jgi:Na+/H+ antiporter NhaD/arsenite permease-like protein
LPVLVSGIPVQYSAGAAATVLLGFYLVRRRAALRWSMLPWRPLLLTIGLFMLIQTLQSHGASTVLRGMAGSGDGLPALLAVGGLGAAAANAINNLPAYLALEPVADTPLRLAALLIGVNLGPLITPWASLATLLWHDRLSALGMRVSWGAYALAGAATVLLLVPAAVLALWAVSGAQQ